MKVLMKGEKLNIVGPQLEKGWEGGFSSPLLYSPLKTLYAQTGLF
jgi:hypothetical protein